MRMVARPIFLMLLASCPSEIAAKEIPVDIYWTDAEPTAVLVSVPGGLQPLRRDAGSRVFHGTITVPVTDTTRQTITLRYGAYSHPFDVRLHPYLQRVTFLVSHQIQNSCTHTHVLEASMSPDNLGDAVDRSVAAGELISIPRPNACNEELRFGALQARFRQNAKMAELSNGFFLINKDVEDQYRQEARAHGVNIDQELAAYDTKDRQFEARQLVAFRDAAAGVHNYEVAGAVNSFMETRILNNAATAALYEKQGVTVTDLAVYNLQLNADRRQMLARMPPSTSTQPPG